MILEASGNFLNFFKTLLRQYLKNFYNSFEVADVSNENNSILYISKVNICLQL